MSNVPQSKPAAPVYVIDANMPWPEVFKVTWKFAVAAFAIWIVLSIPLAILGSALGSWNASREKTAQQEHNRQVERLLMGN
jgi:hypothetical protein